MTFASKNHRVLAKNRFIRLETMDDVIKRLTGL
jgi:hypothetical protein